DQRFDLLDQIDEKEGKLAQCRAENGQASLERDRFQPEHRNIRTAFVNPTPARNAAVSAVGRKRKSAVQRRLTGFNARFNAAARDHDDAQSLEALSFGPRRITSHNGVTAISERAVKARFDLGEWRRDQGRRYGQGASLGERVNPGAEDGRPIIDLPGFFGDARFNLFGSSNITFGENDGVGQDSFSYAVSGGFSYLVLPRLNIGLAGRYQEADVDSAIAEIDADTWGIAAFAQSELPVGGKAIYLEGIVAYSRSDLDSLFNNLGVITTADSITEAFSSQVRASTSFEIERLSISPFLSLSYISTDQASFFLSDGQFAPGAVNDQVTFSSGASLSSSFFLTNTEIELSPSLGLGAFGTVTDGGTVGLSGNGSLGFRSERGIGGGLGVGFSGLTGGTRNLSFSGNISIPLN
ncbi:MAG: autotransporter outer membrane beta-barrel domain-containing protein, partial [Pseudomonadota bacterium]